MASCVEKKMSLPRKGLPPLEILAQGTGIPILFSNEAFCPDEEFLINPSAKSLGGL
jgi:hypothetical protein